MGQVNHQTLNQVNQSSTHAEVQGRCATTIQERQDPKVQLYRRHSLHIQVSI